MPAGSIDDVFQAIPTLLSGLTVKAIESCSKPRDGDAMIGATGPTSDGPIKERRADRMKTKVRRLALPRLETFKGEHLEEAEVSIVKGYATSDICRWIFQDNPPLI